VFVPDKLEPATVPVAATLVGVIAPSPIVIVPLVVIGDPETDTPFDPDAATDVTVPELVPLLADVTLPYTSTVIFADVYDPGVTVVVPRSSVIVPLVVIGEPELVIRPADPLTVTEVTVPALIAVFVTLTTRPFESTVNTGTVVALP
jgi:hypothetical protein